MICRAGKHPRSLLAVVLVAAAAACLVTHARAELPATFAEGKLLASTPLGKQLQVGVYGPDPVSRDEPAVLTVLLEGAQDVTVASGLVLMAAPRTAVTLDGAPTPSGAYTPFGQWSPDFEAETRQLLALNLDALWATRLIAMAPLELADGAGALVDAVVFQRTWALPPAGAPFRDPAQALIGIAFVADDSIRRAAEIADATHGAHRVIFTLPLTFQDPAATLSFWLACVVNGKPISERLQVTLTSRATRRTAAASEAALEILEPAEGAEVGESVVVKGKAPNPGVLVVAWMDASTATDEQPPAGGTIVRHIAGDNGSFSFTMPVPRSPASGDLTLHVRTEAPGYQSPQTLRKLIRKPNL